MTFVYIPATKVTDREKDSLFQVTPSAANELKMINDINKGKRIFPLFPIERRFTAKGVSNRHNENFPDLFIILLP